MKTLFVLPLEIYGNPLPFDAIEAACQTAKESNLVVKIVISGIEVFALPDSEPNQLMWDFHRDSLAKQRRELQAQ